MSSATKSKIARSFSSRVVLPFVSSRRELAHLRVGLGEARTASAYHVRKSLQSLNVEPTMTGTTSLSGGASGSSGTLAGLSQT